MKSGNTDKGYALQGYLPQEITDIIKKQIIVAVGKEQKHCYALWIISQK